MSDSNSGTSKEPGLIDIENREWIESIEWVIQNEGSERVLDLIDLLVGHAQKRGVSYSCPGNTAYINTIPRELEKPYPGDREMERRIKSVIRWNAMAMVVRANRESTSIGGHISTFASAATLYEVAFNHFLRGPKAEDGADIVYYQGHASPGIYARSFLEGQLTELDLKNFRQELRPDGGLASYPHPRSMPSYWEYPTVSMGLGPIQAIYQARFMRYLEDRGHTTTGNRKIWAFLGDGEFDEPESMGALTVAARQKLDNLIFVINCNLQRLDGPVSGNDKIIQSLEAAFRGAGWNVIKVIWGADLDPILEHDTDGLLIKRLGEIPDGQFQRYVAMGGDYIRKDLFGVDDRLLKLVENYSDEQLAKIRRGGHDPVKVYNAYRAAVEHTGSPTVVLAHTIKGYGLGEAGEGRNVTHQQKKLNEEELRYFRGRFSIPISDEDLKEAPFYSLPEDSEEAKYLQARRKELGGSIPTRNTSNPTLEAPDDKVFSSFFEGSGERDVATTMVAVQILGNLLKDKSIGRRIVPIVPDESRTFGMEALFRQVGIYSHVGQRYEPVDKESLLYYNEEKDGAILEEGITESGCMSSFIAAGTSYASYGVPMIPFYIYYSMFGFQRTGDLVWAAADARARGFMIGGTSGRTTLPGEGLQHADGNSHLLFMTVPNIRAYDPTYAYEVATVLRRGIHEMFVEGTDKMYYMTVMNETYKQPPMPKDVEEGILKGMYRLDRAKGKNAPVVLLGSGAILNESRKAREILVSEFDLDAEVWSVPSWQQLYQDATSVERRHRLDPSAEDRTSYIAECFPDERVFVAATDYVKALPLSVATFFPGSFTALGTDGFGRSDNRGALRDYFEVDARHIVAASLKSLHDKGEYSKKDLEKAYKKLEIDADKDDPVAL